MKYEAELEEYLNGLTSKTGKNKGKPIGDGEKRHIRSAVTIFIMDYLGDKDWPCDEDYTRYEAGRRTDKTDKRKSSEDVTKANISRIKKFFSWLEEHGAQATKNDENATKPTEADKTVDAVGESEKTRTEDKTVTMTGTTTITTAAAQEAIAEAPSETLETIPSDENAVQAPDTADTDDEITTKRTEATQATMEKNTAQATAPAPVKHGRKAKSATGEVKSGKVTAYFTFTQLEGLRALCAIDEMSMAELFTEIVDEKLEREKEAIQEYLAFRDKVNAKRARKN